MFELESENLSGLGGPMGSERTTTNWRKFFKTIDAALEHASEDYGKGIKWSKDRNGWTSGDLSHVMYNIRKVKVSG